jgi:hypothetical protein
MRAPTSTTSNTWNCSPFIFYSIVIFIVSGGRRMNDRCADLCSRDRSDDGPCAGNLAAARTVVADGPSAKRSRCGNLSRVRVKEIVKSFASHQLCSNGVADLFVRSGEQSIPFTLGNAWHGHSQAAPGRLMFDTRTHPRETSAVGRERGAADRFGPLALEPGVIFHRS